MLLATSTSEAEKSERQVHVNGHDYTLREYVGAMPLRGRYVDGNESNDNGLPQGFLVYQPPGSVTPPHFHETNQFQVFVDGSGKMGKHAAAPLTIQYANGHTPYGPIEAGDNGVRYFTLRQKWDPGAKYMPQSRDRLRKGNQRTRLKANVPVAAEAERSARNAGKRACVFEAEADGLAAEMVYAAPGETILLSPPDDCGGQYAIVASGVLNFEGKAMDRWSTIFISPDEPKINLEVGSGGADLLILQFPRP
jgi:hypothetical protein